MTEDLEVKAEQLARDAACDRCGDNLLTSPSVLGLVTGSFRTPHIGATTPFKLCGACAIGLREYLDPTILEDPVHQFAATQLRLRWV